MNKTRENELLKLLSNQSSGKPRISYLDHQTFSTLPLRDLEGTDILLCNGTFIGVNNADRGEFLIETKQGQFKVSTGLDNQYKGLVKDESEVELAISLVPPQKEGQQPLVNIKRVFRK